MRGGFFKYGTYAKYREPKPTAKAYEPVPPSSRRIKLNPYRKLKSIRKEQSGESSPLFCRLFCIFFIGLFVLELFHLISPLFPKPVPLPTDAAASNQEAPQPASPAPQQNSSDSGGGHLVTSFPCHPPLAPDWCSNCASFLASNFYGK